MLNFLRLRRADRESQHERTDLRTDLDETSALVLKSHAAAAPQAHKALVRAKKFREISPDSRRNLREINERNVPSLGTKSGPHPSCTMHGHVGMTGITPDNLIQHSSESLGLSRWQLNAAGQLLSRTRQPVLPGFNSLSR